ncbi:MAG TPA: hypothetical protein VEZ48_06840 [Sphingomonadaceae bacterium]|nr:hypothetical protein [Sphingomonadaceae bacterium]
MAHGLQIGLASTLLCFAVTAADAATMGFNLRLTVPLHCRAQFSPVVTANRSGEEVSLGEIREYCNAPQGYELVVSYQSGSLRGARIVAGSDQVVLNGSGEAVLSRQAGPRVRSLPVLATPGKNGFDTDRLFFRLRPA